MKNKKQQHYSPGRRVLTDFFVVLCLVWLIPIESRFVHGFGSLHKTALTFAFVNLPKTALLLVILIATVTVLIYVPFLMVLLPSVMVTLHCTLIERVFKRYERGEF